MFRFKISDLKNFLVYSVYTCLVVYQSRNTYLKFDNKYIYAREFLPAFCPALKLKMMMMIHLMILTVTYTCWYISVVVFMRLQYPSPNGIVLDSTLKVSEDLFLGYLLWIFRPRRFPLHFSLPLDDENMSVAKIYKITVPNNEELSLPKSFTKNLSKEKASDDSPIIIINPVMHSGRGELRKVNVMDKVSICLNN